MRLFTLKASALAVLLSTTTLAHAQSFEDQVLGNLRELGYTAFEIEKGPTQMKVEAYKDGQKIEVVYDLETGRILKQETEAAGDEDMPSDGVEIKDSDEDFVDSDEDEDDDDKDEDEDNDSDEDDDNGSDDDDENDDNVSDDDNDDNGGSDDNDDDNGSDDDNGGSDNDDDDDSDSDDGDDGSDSDDNDSGDGDDDSDSDDDK